MTESVVHSSTPWRSAATTNWSRKRESGKRGVARPAWETLLVLPQAGDTLKFWKSDRWGRSAGHVLTTVNELRDRGITVVSLTENFDLGTNGCE
ncbi:recombinase family protein [Nonomuraea sp. NPDC046802]|uniref:recombinase family protein n=1 Tax=Nonomuraea sp. NPDC046802 TaxID=3154919 RepID=UPI0033F21D90